MCEIEALFLKKDDLTPEQFLEAYKRIQAEDKMMNEPAEDEYDICARIAKLVMTGDNSVDKIEYIIDRCYELFRHLIKTKMAKIEKVHAEIKIMVASK